MKTVFGTPRLDDSQESKVCLLFLEKQELKSKFMFTVQPYLLFIIMNR